MTSLDNSQLFLKYSNMEYHQYHWYHWYLFYLRTLIFTKIEAEVYQREYEKEKKARLETEKKLYEQKQDCHKVTYNLSKNHKYEFLDKFKNHIKKNLQYEEKCKGYGQKPINIICFIQNPDSHNVVFCENCWNNPDLKKYIDKYIKICIDEDQFQDHGCRSRENCCCGIGPYCCGNCRD
jgi:hypothetical protein